MVIGLLCGDVDVVAVDVASFEGCHVGVAEACECAEAEEVTGLGEGAGIVDFFFVLEAFVGVERDFGAIGWDFVFVEFDEFFFCEEDDWFLDYLEFGLDLTDFFFGGVAFAKGPVEEPAEVEVVFLNGFLFHLLGDTEVADEGADAIVVEEFEGVGFCYVGEVLAEGVPALHGACGPLAFDTLFADELVEVVEDVFAFWGEVVFWGCVEVGGVRIIAAD